MGGVLGNGEEMERGTRMAALGCYTQAGKNLRYVCPSWWPGSAHSSVGLNVPRTWNLPLAA